MKAYALLVIVACVTSGFGYSQSRRRPRPRPYGPVHQMSRCRPEEEETTIAPVCGEQSRRTYPNAFLLKCHSHYPSENFSDGPCEDRFDFDPCLYRWSYQKRICGVDNNTYNNIWDLKCSSRGMSAEIEIKYEGECLCEDYNYFYKPVCGYRSSITFANKEALVCYNMKHRTATGFGYTDESFNETECFNRFQSRNPCKNAGFFGEAVCCSNGITYRSIEELKCLLPHNPGLKIVHSGECTVEEMTEAADNLEDPCTVARLRPMYRPVCDSDKKTHENPFVFACYKKNNVGGEITLSRSEGCEDEEDEEYMFRTRCPFLPVPFNANRRLQHYGGGGYGGFHPGGGYPNYYENSTVCGNDGLTYDSIEDLCEARKTNNRIFPLRKGDCLEEDHPCYKLKRGSDYFANPVCGTDGKTYGTPNSLWCAATENEGLAILHGGQCLEESK